MVKIIRTISVDSEIWKEFKKDCIDKNTEASKAIEELIKRKRR